MKSICFIVRKKNPLFFSIEKVFEPIIRETKKKGWNAEVIEAPLYTSGVFSMLRNIFSLREKKADLYHITGDIHYAVFAFPRKRTILTIHDSVFVYQQKGFKRWVMLQLFLKWPASYASCITTISEKSKSDIVRFGKCRPDKIKIIPDPVNSSITYTPRTFNSSKPVILFIGSTPNKNLPRALEAIRGISCLLSIVAKISEDHKALMDTMGIEYTVSSNLSEEELNRKYAESDLLLFPTLFEGFGLPIIEAQQAGRPVITSKLDPMQEVAGKGACLVDPYDVASIRAGLLRVIDEPLYRSFLVEEGFENIKRYSKETILRHYLDLYETRLGGRDMDK